MKRRIPLGRFDLRIKKSDRVLEVGPGHNPHPRSNVLVEKFIDDNTHRCGDVVVGQGQELLNYDGDNMPFKDKEFDYVICNQVLEHVDDPVAFCQELSRVGKRGYLECPSIIGEFLFPKESHKWVVMQLDDRLYAFEKSKMSGDYKNNYGELFLNYLPYQSLLWKLMWIVESNLMINKIEWEDNIQITIVKDDSTVKRFFTEKWDREMTQRYSKKRNLHTELKNIARALCYLGWMKLALKG
jgi:SAM-dependent methyltransferase